MPDADPSPAFGLALDLASVVCARVCHDIAGPLGALAGILDQAVSSDQEAGDLAMELAALLAARVRLLRTAWGGGEAVAPGDLAGLLPGLPGADRLRVDTSRLAADSAEDLRRMVPLLLLVAAAALPRGGKIQVASEGDGLRVAVEGAKACWPALLGVCAASADAGLAVGEPRDVAVKLACLLAHRLRLSVALTSAQSLLVHPGPALSA